MKNGNDIDTDLTRRFDMEELRREMDREARLKNARNNSSGHRSNSNVRKTTRVSQNNKNIRKTKKTTKFKRRMKAYIIFLSVLSILFLAYVMNTLYQYEDSFTDNYMSKVMIDITKVAKKGKISKICDTNSIKINKLDNSGKTCDSAIQQVFNTSEITYKLNNKTKNTNNPVYDIYANSKKIMEVTLKVKVKKHRLGLFTYPIWEVDNYKLATDRGIEFFDICVPSNYTVEVNGNKLGEEYISKKTANEDYDKFSKYLKLPSMVNYELDNFLDVPKIEIKDNKGNKVDTYIKDNKIEIANSYVTASNYAEAKKHIKGDIDILKLAENWSLFLTDDLTEGTSHGFSLLRPYLIKGSNLYDMAYAWATSIDITFVSKHTLKNPTFTNEELTDFVIYNDRAFSCSVNLEKNMKIANGNDKVDIMHDKLYFVYYDDTDDGEDNPSWKLIDMKSIVEKD